MTVWSQLTELSTKRIRCTVCKFPSIFKKDFYKIYTCAYVAVFYTHLSFKGMRAPDLKEKHFSTRTNMLPSGTRMVKVGDSPLDPKYQIGVKFGRAVNVKWLFL